MKTATRQPFGERLRGLRERADLTAYALGKAAGTDTITVQRYERGDISPGLEMAQRLADALAVTLAAFDACSYPERAPKKIQKKT